MKSVHIVGLPWEKQQNGRECREMALKCGRKPLKMLTGLERTESTKERRQQVRKGESAGVRSANVLKCDTVCGCFCSHVKFLAAMTQEMSGGAAVCGCSLSLAAS